MCVRILCYLSTFLGVLSAVLVSCSSPDDEWLQVRPFHLKDAKVTDINAQMARGEQLYRFRGAVTMEERMSRLGYYYTVTWKKNQGDTKAGKMTLVMEYQQAATASKVLRMSRDIPSDVDSGKVEFRIAGESYRVGGQVLSWRIRMMQDGQVLAEKQSYLWK